MFTSAELWLAGQTASDGRAELARSEEPVWLLGVKYSSLHELDELMADFRTRLWMTYRTGFAPIGGNGPSSDSGWGCMLRCGQMVLAQALMQLHLGRDWRWTRGGRPGRELHHSQSRGSTEQLRDAPISEQPRPDDGQSRKRELEDWSTYLKLLSLFEDKKNSLYSIHQIAQMGASEGKPVGTWMGPNTIAQALKKLSLYDHWNEYCIHVALDNSVIIGEIQKECRSKVTNAWKPLLLFIPLRLGLSDVNPIYFKALRTTFRLKHSLGIIGGRPNHALYFIGNVGNDLIYLDPHRTQSVVDSGQDDSSYHCPEVLKMNVQYLDPSISLCFFCATEDDFNSWCQLVKRALILNEKQPLFELTKERQPMWNATHPVEVAQDAASISADSFANYDLETGPMSVSRNVSVSTTASSSSSYAQVVSTAGMAVVVPPERLQTMQSMDSCSEAFSMLEDHRTLTRRRHDSSDEDFELLG